MSKPRRMELRRRQRRRARLKELRQQYSEAKSESEKSQVLERLAKVAPMMSSEQFLATTDTEKKE